MESKQLLPCCYLVSMGFCWPSCCWIPMNAKSSLLCVSLYSVLCSRHEKLHKLIFFNRMFSYKLSFSATFMSFLAQSCWLLRIFANLSLWQFYSYFLLDLGKLGLEAAKHLIWLKIGKTETTLTTAICNSLYWVFPSVESGRSNR